MSSDRLTYAEIVEAATGLLREGRNPSATAVIERLGRGSKTTAIKHLEVWRQTLQETGFRLPPGVPETLTQPLETFWGEAIRLAAIGLEFDRIAFAEQNQAVEQARHDLQRALKEQQAAADSLRTELRERDAALGQLREHLETAKQETESLRAQILRLEETVEREKERAVAKLREVEIQTNARIEAKDQELAALADKLALSIERWDSSEKRWLMEVAKARDHAKARDEAADAERTRYRSDLRMAEEIAQMARAERDQAQMAKTKLETDLDRERKEFDAATRRKDGENQRLQSRIEQLEQLLAQHFAAGKDNDAPPTKTSP